MREFSFILAESGLETVPEELQRQRSICEEANRLRTTPDRLLLDSSRHLSFMGKLPEKEKRGRPDIVHTCALLALDSPLNMDGKLDFFVHTRDDLVISFSQGVRIPRVYDRFCGVACSLFNDGKVEHDGKMLMEVKEQSLAQLLAQLKPKKVVVFDPKGERKKIKDLTAIAEPGTAFVIGGFPHGSFSSKCLDSYDKVSISGHELCAWTVVSRALAACEIASGE